MLCFITLSARPISWSTMRISWMRLDCNFSITLLWWRLLCRTRNRRYWWLTFSAMLKINCSLKSRISARPLMTKNIVWRLQTQYTKSYNKRYSPRNMQQTLSILMMSKQFWHTSNYSETVSTLSINRSFSKKNKTIKSPSKSTTTCNTSSSSSPHWQKITWSTNKDNYSNKDNSMLFFRQSSRKAKNTTQKNKKWRIWKKA